MNASGPLLSGWKREHLTAASPLQTGLLVWARHSTTSFKCYREIWRIEQKLKSYMVFHQWSEEVEQSRSCFGLSLARTSHINTSLVSCLLILHFATSFRYCIYFTVFPTGSVVPDVSTHSFRSVISSTAVFAVFYLLCSEKRTPSSQSKRDRIVPSFWANEDNRGSIYYGGACGKC